MESQMGGLSSSDLITKNPDLTPIALDLKNRAEGRTPWLFDG